MTGGPPRVPTAILEKRGSRKAKHRQAEMDKLDDLPPEPLNMSETAKNLWTVLIPMLDGVNVLSSTDFISLQILCETYAEWHSANEILMEFGTTYIDDAGVKRPRPEVAIRRDSRRDMTRLFQEFGLTPSARSKIVVDSRGLNNKIGSIT
jgi:P27 family predicted phage terminase small subunit